jgi:hypothetical protein
MRLNEEVFDTTDSALLAMGSNSPDALAGTPLAGALGAPITLTGSDCLAAGAYTEMRMATRTVLSCSEEPPLSRLPSRLY